MGQETTNKGNSKGFGKCLGNVWEMFGKCLGNVWNILSLIIKLLIWFFGKCLGNVWEMFGKCLGNSGEVGECLGNSGEVGEVYEKDGGDLKKKWKKSVKMFFSTKIVL
jgi:hypothetical protein